MIRTFIETPSFVKKWEKLGLNDNDLSALQSLLLKNTEAGNVIAGTGGLRKVRIPIDNTGKRSGGRVLYVDIKIKEKIHLIDVYAKNEKIDISEEEKKIVRKLVECLKEE